VRFREGCPDLLQLVRGRAGHRRPTGLRAGDPGAPAGDAPVPDRGGARGGGPRLAPRRGVLKVVVQMEGATR
jgi:hypothetical protein